MALLPNRLVDHAIASGRLVRFLPDHEATATTFGTAARAVDPNRSFLPAKVRVMIDFLRETLGQPSSVAVPKSRAASSAE